MSRIVRGWLLSFVVIIIYLIPAVAQHAPGSKVTVSKSDILSLKTLAVRYFEAFSKGDVSGMGELVNWESPDIAERNTAVRQILRGGRNVELKSLTVDQVVIRGRQASIYVTVDISVPDTDSGKSRVAFRGMHRQLWCVKGGYAFGEEGIRNVGDFYSDFEPDFIPPPKTDEDLWPAPDAKDAPLNNEGDGSGIRRLQIYRGDRWLILRDKPDTDYMVKALMRMKDERERREALQLESSQAIGEVVSSLQRLGITYLDKKNTELGFTAFRIAQQAHLLYYNLFRERRALLRKENYQKQLKQAEDALEKTRQEFASFKTSPERVASTPPVPESSTPRFRRRPPPIIDPAEETEDSDPVEEAIRLQNQVAERTRQVGYEHFRYGNYPLALEFFEKSLADYEQLGNKGMVAFVLDDIGDLYLKQGNETLALDFFERSLDWGEKFLKKSEAGKRRNLFSGFYSPGSLPRTLNKVADIYRKRKDYERAVAYLQRAADKYKEMSQQPQSKGETNNRDSLLESYSNQLLTIAELYVEWGRLDLAVAQYQKASQEAAANGDEEAQADLLMATGVLYYKHNNHEMAVVFFNKAISAYEALGDKLSDKDGIAVVRMMLGIIHLSLGEYSQAATQFNKVRFEPKETRREGELSLKRLLNSLPFFMQGSETLGMEVIERSISIQDLWRGNKNVPETLNRAGDYFGLRGDVPLALQCYESSLELSEAANDKEMIARSLSIIGNYYAERKEYAKAVEFFRRRLDVVEHFEDKKEYARALKELGQLYNEQKNYAVALAYYEKCLHVYETLEGERFVDVLNEIAGILIAQKEYAQALDVAGRAAVLSKREGEQEEYWKACGLKGQASFALGRNAEAEASATEAINAIENMRVNIVGGEQERGQFLEARISPYQTMVEVLISQGKVDAAIDFSERIKSRVLLEIMQGGKLSLGKVMTKEEREEDAKLLARLESLNLQIRRELQHSATPGNSTTQLYADQKRARIKYEAHQASVFAAHPELRVPPPETRPATVEDINILLRDPSSAILEYVVTAEKTYLFVITEGVFGYGESSAAGTRPQVRVSTNLKVYTLAMTSDVINDYTTKFRQALSERQKDFKTSARQLYDLLLGPALEQLGGMTHLVIIPDGPLWNLPFQALLSPCGRYLVEDAAISYAPSLAVLREAVKKSDQHAKPNVLSPNYAPHLLVLAVGNPSLGGNNMARVRAARRGESLGALPDAEEEARQISELYGLQLSNFYKETEATESLVKRVAGRYKVLHLATHGLLDDNSPMYSQLVLATGDAEDGLLEAREVMDMDLHADLAVLSACDSGRGRVGAGEGLIGLTWAFFAAGVPTTVASQWKVDSKSTTELMVEFHKQLKPRVMGDAHAPGPAESLRRAELKLLRSEEYSHPFYWAGFVVMGDGR